MTIVCRVREQAVLAFFLFIFKDMCTNNFLQVGNLFLCTMLFAECVSLRGLQVFVLKPRKLHWPLASFPVFDVFAYGSE